jgi:hypothetical protein
MTARALASLVIELEMEKYGWDIVLPVLRKVVTEAWPKATGVDEMQFLV